MTIELQKRQARAALQQGLEPGYEYKSGLVLELDGSVFRGGSRHDIWVQPVGVDASPVVVFSQHPLTDVQAGWEVIYQQSPKTPEPWQLVRINKAPYAQQIDQLNTFPDPSIPQHAREHEIRADHVGTQPIIVYDRMIARFNVQPTSPPSMRVQILPGAYAGLTYHEFITSIKLSEDMTARIPSTTNMARLVGIGLDRDGNFTYANGAEFSKSEEFPPKTAFPDISNQDDLIGTLYFEQGMTAITNANFKFFYSNVGGGAGRVADVPYRIAGAIGPGGAASQPTTADSVAVTDDIQFKQDILIGGVNGNTPSAALTVREDESTTKTDFTQAVSSAGFLIRTDQTTDAYTPGVFWHTANNSPTLPKAGIFLQTGATGSNMIIGTSNAYATGITNDAIAINPSGNVGLSTTDPSSTLTVRGDESASQTDFTQKTTSVGILIETDQTTDAYTPGLFWQTKDNNATRPKGGIYLQTGVTGSKMLLGTSNAYATGITNDGIVIDGDGQVGINEVTPQFNLHVSPSSSGSVPTLFDDGILIQNDTTTGTSSRLVIQAGNAASSIVNFGDTDSSTIGHIQYLHSSNEMRIRTNGTDALYIDSSGQLGVSESSPQMALHVSPSAGTVPTLFNDGILVQNNGSTSDVARFVLIGGATGSSIINFGDASSSVVGHIQYDHNADEMIFRTNSANRLYIDSAGDVGIGASSPSGQLHVDQTSTTGAQPVLYLDQADLDQPMIQFETTIGTGNAVEAVGAKTLTTTHFIMIELPGGITRYIPAGTIA